MIYLIRGSVCLKHLAITPYGPEFLIWVIIPVLMDKLNYAAL